MTKIKIINLFSNFYFTPHHSYVTEDAADLSELRVIWTFRGILHPDKAKGPTKSISQAPLSVVLCQPRLYLEIFNYLRLIRTVSVSVFHDYFTITVAPWSLATASFHLSV